MLGPAMGRGMMGPARRAPVLGVPRGWGQHLPEIASAVVVMGLHPLHHAKQAVRLGNFLSSSFLRTSPIDVMLEPGHDLKLQGVEAEDVRSADRVVEPRHLLCLVDDVTLRTGEGQIAEGEVGDRLHLFGGVLRMTAITLTRLPADRGHAEQCGRQSRARRDSGCR
jgi:hypothetical protein